MHTTDKTSEHRGLAVFSSREDPDTLVQTITAALGASDNFMVVDVIINGNRPLVEHTIEVISRHNSGPDEADLRIWSIQFGDKANAWNEYFHTIWSGEALTFFIDGYVQLERDSVNNLGSRVMANTHVLGGTGIPTAGRSARRLAEEYRSDGGFHGNFCCIKAHAIQAIKEMNFRIPLGLYRTDSLVGAILAFGLDPAVNEWDLSRILIAPDANWATPTKHWWRPQDIIATYKRRVRQSRGQLEIAAFRDHLARRKESAATLPHTAYDLVDEWRTRHPEDYCSIRRRHPLSLLDHSFRKPVLSMDADMLHAHLVWQRPRNNPD